MQKYADSELLEMLKFPDKKAQVMTIIVRTYQERLYWHIRKILISHEDSNDVIQNTFIKIHQNLQSFKGNAKLSTWMITIATNESLQFLKKKKRHILEPLENVALRQSDHLTAENYFSGDEIAKKLQEAILTLPIKQRVAFNMKYFDEMKYEEISKVLGTSVGALKANYHHAKNKIQEYLKNH